MILWRIAAATRKYKAEDLTGGGAADNPGRWNDQSQPVIYTALFISTAVLETVAHLDDAGLPLNRFLIRIEVPDQVWAAKEELAISDLPQTWDAIPAGWASVKVGSDWLTSKRSPILLIPSVIVPEDKVALVNPQHPSARFIKASIVRPMDFNRVFRTS